MMARSSKAPSMGRIQKRKTNFLQIIIFALQRAAGPYRRAKLGHFALRNKTIVSKRVYAAATAMPFCSQELGDPCA